ncbi:hypothetical protein GQX74_009678 [Glossina fuscipes]|nr:hypothetical protein GQX74_009678 [Glossina fuscipes]
MDGRNLLTYLWADVKPKTTLYRAFPMRNTKGSTPFLTLVVNESVASVLKKSGHPASYGFGSALLRSSAKTAEPGHRLKAAIDDIKSSSSAVQATVMALPTKRVPFERARHAQAL